MTNEAERTSYLMGDADGSGLGAAERTALNRIGGQLANEAVWDQPSVDARSRLLAAAAGDSRRPSGRGSAEPPSSFEVDRDSGSETEPISLEAHRKSRDRTKWFGAGAVAAAAVAAIGFVGVSQLPRAQDDGGKEVAAVYELASTPLDPDATANLDIVPTDAGVEFWLHLKGLDNTTGPDYYSAWLVGENDVVPVGSFHWRKGGVDIILWSGVDDPSYDQFMVTRQTLGDGGVRSDQVVLMGSVGSLTGPGS